MLILILILIIFDYINKVNDFSLKKNDIYNSIF